MFLFNFMSITTWLITYFPVAQKKYHVTSNANVMGLISREYTDKNVSM